jgi:arylformamidase
MQVSTIPHTSDPDLLEEVTRRQKGLFRKFGYFISAPARTPFEYGYYCNFPLKSGYPNRLSLEGLLVMRDQSYGNASPLQCLDIFTTEQTKGQQPVFIFIHGGAWRSADKSEGLKVHENLCIRLARMGMVCVNINHRLSPKVQFPTIEQDVAQAVRWVVDNIEIYGGDLERIFIGGHSSGGHLAATMVSSPTYLTAVGVEQQQIKGVVSISGVMDIPEFEQHSWFQRHLTVRPYFGKDAQIQESASPYYQADHTVPPFLLVHAEKHDEGLDIQAKRMQERLHELGVPVQRKAYPDTDHFLILSKVNERNYSLPNDIAEFIFQN